MIIKDSNTCISLPISVTLQINLVKVLDKNGHLMGLNFDRSWESTMSDYMFDPSRCRNIVVDIHYVLWVMDKYAGAKHLVDEMKLMKEKKFLFLKRSKEFKIQ